MNHRIFAALFLLSPLIILTNFPYPYSLPRWVFITLLCCIWSITLLIDGARKKIDLHLSILDWALIAFVLIVGLTTITSTNSTQSLWGSLERSFAFSLWPSLLVAFFGLKVALQKPNNRFFLLRFFTLTIFVASLWGMLQKFVPGFSQTFSGSRIGGTLGNAIFFGSYLTLSTGILALKLTEEKKYSAWWLFTCTTSVLAVITVLLTQTRGPLLGLCVGIFFALTAYLYKVADRKRMILLGAAAIILAAVIAGVIAYKKNLITQTTITTRILNWNIAWNGFKDKPLFGWGPENYNRAADKNFIPSLTNYSIAETHADKPHNYFLEILVTSGIVGLIAYFFLLAAAAHTLLRAKLPPTEFSILLGILAASVAQNLSSFETHGTIALFIFALSLIAVAQKDDTLKKTQLPILTLLMIGSSAVVLYGTTTIIKDSSAYFSAIKLSGTYQSHHESIKKLQQNFESTPFTHDYFTTISFAIIGQYWQNPTGYAQLTPNELKLHAEDLEWLRNVITKIDNEQAVNGVWKLSLANSSYQLFSLTRSDADGARAIKLFTDYSYIAPNRQEPLMQLGQLELLRNNPEKALTYFDAAIKLEPEYKTPHWQRSLSLFALKKHALAWNEIEFLMSKNYEFTPPQIANYVYNQLLGNGLLSEAEKFRLYFERFNA